MRLRQLIRRLPESTFTGLDAFSLPDIEVLGIQDDSRRVRTGDLFVARAGGKTDGKRFIADAHKAGAVAVLCDAPVDGCPLPQVVAADTDAASSILAHALLGDPSRAIQVLAVTGTNGKTTTTYLLRHILARAGIRCGLIGTCEIDDGTHVREATMTTPGPVDVAELLASMRNKGCRACAIETSSHALQQGRVAGVEFAAGGFTNLTGDHLDYHGTMEKYAAAKARLFEMLPASARAAVNGGDAWSARMVRDTRAKVARFSTSGNNNDGTPADYRAADASVTAAGTRFTLHTPAGSAPVQMRLVGRHNIENVLCAAAIAMETFGLSPLQVAAALVDAAGAPGRLQRVEAGQPFPILVDYAHTDDALENVLTALRPLTRGKLRVLFGCGGDRDKTKRPRMARVAARMADCVYVTSDNPRTEDPAAILADIVAGFEPGYRPALAEPDRHAAIRRIIADAGEGDVVLLAGKGHETYQILGTVKHHFDDAEEAARAVREAAPGAAA